MSTVSSTIDICHLYSFFDVFILIPCCINAFRFVGYVTQGRWDVFYDRHFNNTLGIRRRPSPQSFMRQQVLLPHEEESLTWLDSVHVK